MRIKKEKVIEFIKKHPKATYRKIREKIHIKVPDIFYGGMAEAFKEAKIRPPRTFLRKSKEEKKQILISYIRAHPKVGGHTIRKDTKINFFSIFNSTKEIFDAAEVDYPRKEIYQTSPDEKRKMIIKSIKRNPLLTIPEISKKVNTNPYHLFKDIHEIYRAAGMKPIQGQEKRRAKKQQEVIHFIKNNPLATQREINNSCRTHVQLTFKQGIFEAYKKAGIPFPYTRLKLYGVGIKDIRKRAKKFEDNIAIRLSGYGKVNRLVRTSRGIADIVLERKGRKVIIEVKDYCAKDISTSQIEQLYRYLEDTNCSLGFLICRKKPKKDTFLMGQKQVVILTEKELKLIPNIIDGGA